MAQAPPLTPPTRRARRPGRGNGRRAGTRPFASPLALGASRIVHPNSTSIVLAERETSAKWLRVQPPTKQAKQYVKRYPRSVFDEPFLNRVSQVRILPGAPLLNSKNKDVKIINLISMVRLVVRNAVRLCHDGGQRRSETSSARRDRDAAKRGPTRQGVRRMRTRSLDDGTSSERRSPPGQQRPAKRRKHARAF
jgi:hypothetical protein